MSIYENVPDSEIRAELAEPNAKPRDVDGDELPFSHLGGARFELLSYLLRCKEAAGSGVTATLVKFSGDRGRDLLIHKGGRLTEIIQCKNLGAPMTKPAVIRELLKIALHSRLDPSILPGDASPIRVSMWCTGGFTEPAAQFIDNWPTNWPDANLQGLFDEIIEKYKLLSGLSWAETTLYFHIDELA
jgi:hypothetical protein